MLKVHPGWIIFVMMLNAFLLYVFAAVAKMPATLVTGWVLVGMGGVLASLGVFLGIVTSKVSVVTDGDTAPAIVKVEAQSVKS